MNLSLPVRFDSNVPLAQQLRASKQRLQDNTGNMMAGKERVAQKPVGSASPSSTSNSANTEGDSHDNHAPIAKLSGKSTDEIDGDDYFTLFPNLPIEIRLKIWGFVDVQPCVIYMRPSTSITCRRDYGFERPIPPVLHTCRESRREFLEQGPNQPARKANHPVYKLLFRDNPDQLAPVLLCPDIDTFWGEETHQQDYTGVNSFRNWKDAEYCASFLDKEIVDSVKHLAVRQNHYSHENPEFFHKTFPNLQTLTIILSPHQWARVTDEDGSHWLERKIYQYAPEVEGQIDMAALPPNSHNEAAALRLRKDFNEAKEKHPEWNLPELKIRALPQFIENDNMDVGMFTIELGTERISL